MSSETSTEQTPKVTVRMQLDAWTYEDYLEFVGSMRTNNFRKAFDMAGLLITSWGYPTPFSTQALKALPSLEGMRVLRTVLDTLDNWSKSIDTAEVTLDMSKWSLDDFLSFNDLQKSGEARKIMNRVKLVASVAGFDGKGVPTMTQGVLMVKAVHDAIDAILSGKN